MTRSPIELSWTAKNKSHNFFLSAFPGIKEKIVPRKKKTTKTKMMLAIINSKYTISKKASIVMPFITKRKSQGERATTTDKIRSIVASFSGLLDLTWEINHSISMDTTFTIVGRGMDPKKMLSVSGK